QILLNLLLNAIAASAEGGRVVLAASDGGGWLRLTVGNDGAHIPEDQIDYVFEPFVTGRAKGNGLGLWIVYQIVQQLKGTISVESRPGWTTFSIGIAHDQLLEEPAPSLPDRG
ncbi:MAG: HAMP domain-containing histidine kinase, partial [Alphaproteobacteria bacterium]|nr:HAMP domain-containing histidine kinase [Alphaproteobacteria bacterium]